MKPSWSQLTPEQQALFGNGFGPSWLPDTWRNWITDRATWFFGEASYKHHDFGYWVGYKERHRWQYDWKFFRAMLRDAGSQGWLLSPLAYTIAVIFYIAVMVAGWCGSFEYGDDYNDLETILQKQTNKK